MCVANALECMLLWALRLAYVPPPPLPYHIHTPSKNNHVGLTRAQIWREWIEGISRTAGEHQRAQTDMRRIGLLCIVHEMLHCEKLLHILGLVCDRELLRFLPE